VAYKEYSHPSRLVGAWFLRKRRYSQFFYERPIIRQNFKIKTGKCLLGNGVRPRSPPRPRMTTLGISEISEIIVTFVHSHQDTPRKAVLEPPTPRPAPSSLWMLDVGCWMFDVSQHWILNSFCIFNISFFLLPYQVTWTSAVQVNNVNNFFSLPPYRSRRIVWELSCLGCVDASKLLRRCK